jgi:hypothetical protein
MFSPKPHIIKIISQKDPFVSDMVVIYRKKCEQDFRKIFKSFDISFYFSEQIETAKLAHVVKEKLVC